MDVFEKRIKWIQVQKTAPIGTYIADFYCHKAKLIIEVDGGIHHQPETIKADKEKEDFIERNGYNLLRFRNEEVLKRIEEVVKRITIVIHNNIDKQSPNIGD